MVSTRRQAAANDLNNSRSQTIGSSHTQNTSAPSLNATTQSTPGQLESSSAPEDQPRARRMRRTKSAVSASMLGSTSAAQPTGIRETSPELNDDRRAAKGGGSQDAQAQVSKPPPKRRRKNGKWTARMKLAASEAREVRRSLLRSFMELPQDIILEMFSHLPPKALLAIGRTNKELRAMVFCRRHVDIWKYSRATFGVPEPPERLSEPRWASLLFDSARCQVCWDATDSDIDWYFLRRTCYRCRQAHSVSLPLSRDLLDTHPQRELLRLVDIEIMQYITHGPYLPSPYYPWGRTYASFWDEDVLGVVKEWQELARNTDSAGRNEFHAWKIRRRETMRNHLNMITTYRLWRISTMYPSKKLIRHKEQRAACESRIRKVEDMKARLREAGHISKDIDLCTRLDSSDRHGPLTLTDAAWEAMRAKIESDVEEQKAFRLALKMEPVIHERLLVLQDVYQDFLSILPPSEQYFCPSLSSLRVDPFIVSILETDGSVAITHAYLRAKLGDMRTYVDKAHNDLKHWFRDRMGGTGSPWELANLVFGRVWHPSDNHPERASDRVLVGWDMVATHSYDGRSKDWLRPGVPMEFPRAFELNSKSSLHAEGLLAAAGFRRASGTTVKMVDDRDPRFVCETCEGACNVFTFRAALAHLHDNESHKVRFANRRETRAAKDNEGPLREQAKAWSCNHCAQYLEASDADTKQAVLDHVAEVHDVTDPQLLQDYFVNERCRIAYELPYVYESNKGRPVD